MNVDSYFKTSLAGHPEDRMKAEIIPPPLNLHHSTIMSTACDSVLDAAGINNLAFLTEICPNERFKVLCVARWITPKFFQPGDIMTGDMDDWGFPQDENTREQRPGKRPLEPKNQSFYMSNGGFIPAYYGSEPSVSFELTSTTVDHDQWKATNEDHEQWEARNEGLDELFSNELDNGSLHKNLGHSNGGGIPRHHILPSVDDSFLKTNTANELSKLGDKSSAESWLHSMLPYVPDHESIHNLVLDNSDKVTKSGSSTTWVTQTIASGSSTEKQGGVPPIVLLMPVSDNDIVSVLHDEVEGTDDFMGPAVISVKALDGSVSEASTITDDEDTVMTENDDTYSFVGTDYSPNTIGCIE